MVRVKPFPERKMFSCVWLHFKKIFGKYFLMFGKEEGQDKPKKNIMNDRDLAINGASSRRRDLAIDASRDRDLGRRRDRDQLRDLVTARDRDLRGDRRIGDRRRLELGVHRRSLD